MAKKGYTVGGVVGGIAEQGGKAVGKLSQTGQDAVNSSASGVDTEVDIDQEQSSQVARDSTDALSEGGQLAKGVVEAPGRTVQTVKNAKKRAKKMKEAWKKGKRKAKKTAKRMKNFFKDPKGYMAKVKRARKLRKNNLGKKGSQAAKNVGNGVKNGANAAKNTASAAKKSADAAKKSAEATKKTAETTGKVAKAIIKTGIKIVKKLPQVFKAIGKALVRLVKGIIALVVNPYFWLVVVIILILIGLMILFVHLGQAFLDSYSTSGDYTIQGESGGSGEGNKLTIDENGNIVATDISGGNKIITAYYTYFSTKSLWVLFDGDIYTCRTDTVSSDTSIVSNKLPKETVTINGVNYEVMTPIQYGSAEFIDIFQYDPFTESGINDDTVLLQDKYKRESNFYLSADSIASLDNTLHNGEFRYPEQIVQKVKYKIVIDNASTGEYHYELDDLTDENGLLFRDAVYDTDGTLLHQPTLSTKYTQNTSETSATYSSGDQTNLWLPCVDSNGNVTEKTVGVWDYGFGSILHYMKYIEAHENRGEVVSFEVIHNGIWDLVNDNNETDPAIQTIVTTKIAGAKHDYLAGFNKTVNLYKNAVMETMDYNTWNTLDDVVKSEYFTGEGEIGDPTHEKFNKNRVYGLPSTTAYMIDWVVTPAGTMTTNVQTIWKDSGIPFSTVENDGTADFSDEEFNGKDYGQGAYEEFDNGADDDITYTDTTVTVQTVTHMGVGNKASVKFEFGEANINTTNGDLKTNPTATVYLIRYVPTDSDEVNAKFAYTQFTENGETKYYLNGSNRTIKMFTKVNGVWECNNCGKTPTTVTYKVNGHSSCKSYTVQIPVYKNGVKTSETRGYKVSYQGTLKIDSSTGKITSYPTAYYPPDYCEVDDKGVVTWVYKPHEKNANGSYKYRNPKLDENGDVKFDYWLTPSGTYAGSCRVCGKQVGKVEYKANNHNGCCEVKYEYDVIETKEMQVSQKIVDVDGTENDQYVFPGGYVQLSRNIEGTQWDKEPTYSGEPDTSKITGSKYYTDYFKNYESYVPTNVQKEFNFEEIKEQVGLEQEELLELLERQTLSKSVATLNGIEDFFIDGTPQINDGVVSGYVGPGLGIVAFEQGMPATEQACRDYMEKGATARPYDTATLSGEGWPNYGCCQMNRGTMDGFRAWMLSDPDRAAMWDKLFDGIEYDISSESTGFSQAWRDSRYVLNDDEYITFMLYQIAYMYKIKVADNWTLISKFIPNFETYRATQEMVLACGNNGALESAVKFGGFGVDASDIVNRLADIYSTYIGFGEYTAVMRNKYNKYIRQYYLVMDEYQLPVFTWDEEKQMFDLEGLGNSSGGYNPDRLWNELLKEHEGDTGEIFYPWNSVFKNSQVNVVKYTTSSGKVVYGGTDANATVERVEYFAPAMSEATMDFEIAKIFASADKVPVSTYQPMTDDFFKIRYQELFDENLSRKWSVKRSGISAYLPDGWTGIFVKDKESTLEGETGAKDVEYTIIKEYDKTDNPIVEVLLTYGGTDAATNKNKPITIHSASKGVVLELGQDIDYGGAYMVVQYKKSVIYYGGLSSYMGLEVGDTVYKKTPIGQVASGSYLYLAMKTSVSSTANYIDPTQLLKGGLQEVVDLAREFLGYDYEWGGHGDKSCFGDRCVCKSDHKSYLNGIMYGFDCSGLVTYVFKNLGFEYGSGGWTARGANGYRDIGEDVTLAYTNADGSIDWDSVPAGILVYFDWDGNGDAEHIGIWSGENSLVHASGGNPYLHDEKGNYILDANGNYQIGDVTRNHAVHDCMIKEYFMGDVPSGAYNSPYAIENGLNTLRANAFGSYYMSCVIELRDFSQYQK